MYLMFNFCTVSQLWYSTKVYKSEIKLQEYVLNYVVWFA